MQTSQYANVQDFLWIRATPSPNWSLMPEDAMIQEETWKDLAKGTQNPDESLEKLLPKIKS